MSEPDKIEVEIIRSKRGQLRHDLQMLELEIEELGRDYTANSPYFVARIGFLCVGIKLINRQIKELYDAEYI